MTPTCDETLCASETESIGSRRHFLEQVKTITLGAITLTVFPAWSSNDEGPSVVDASLEAVGQQTKGGTRPIYAYLVDTEKCIGSGKCLSACRTENNVPDGNHRTWVERYIHYKDGTVSVDLVPESGYAGSGLPIVDASLVEKSYFVPKLCNHCEDAPCNQVCPVHASFTSPEGFELIDAERCIGCAYCVRACPYGVRFINHETGTADKCTWCYHRVARNEQPACVEACPVGARLFGRIDDPDSEISKRLAQVPTNVLKQHLGTHPKTQYVGLSKEVI